MKNEMQHTPGPWKTTGGIIFGPDSKNIADVFSHGSNNRETSEQNANAAYIVHCCNLHQELTEALHNVVTAGEACFEDILKQGHISAINGQAYRSTKATARAVLAKAKGE